jgi:hypothetical protein
VPDGHPARCSCLAIAFEDQRFLEAAGQRQHAAQESDWNSFLNLSLNLTSFIQIGKCRNEKKETQKTTHTKKKDDAN